MFKFLAMGVVGVPSFGPGVVAGSGQHWVELSPALRNLKRRVAASGRRVARARAPARASGRSARRRTPRTLRPSEGRPAPEPRSGSPSGRPPEGGSGVGEGDAARKEHVAAVTCHTATPRGDARARHVHHDPAPSWMRAPRLVRPRPGRRSGLLRSVYLSRLFVRVSLAQSTSPITRTSMVDH